MLWLLIAAGFLIPKSDNILVNTLRYIFIVVGILGVMGLGLGGGIFSFR